MSDLHLAGILLAGLRAFDPTVGLTPASDVSFLSPEDIDRGEAVIESMSPEELEAALASLNADIACAKGRAS